jgi:hypothetical protein
MSKVEQIEEAIRSLPPEEREQLVRDLPSILPELDGDAEWVDVLPGREVGQEVFDFIDGNAPTPR